MPQRFSKAVPLLLTLAAVLFPEVALAQVDTIGQAADHVVSGGNFQSMWDLFSGLGYVAGAFFGVKSALQLKDHNDAPHQTKLSKPVMTLFVSAMLMAFPSFVAMLQGTYNMAEGVSLLNPSGSNGGPSQSANMDLGQMFVALASSVPGLMRISSYAAVTAGAFFMLRALFMLPQVEQGRESAGKVFWMATAGVGLWSLLPMISMAMTTIGMSSTSPASILTAKYASAATGFDGTVASVQAFVQLLGLIAFIRGMMILKAIGENKDGAWNRALTHIVGGSMAMNIGWTVKLLAWSIGSSTTICGLASTMCA